MAIDKIENLLSIEESERLFDSMADVHFCFVECAKEENRKKGLFLRNGFFIVFNNETGFFHANEYKDERLAKLWLRNSLIF